MKALFEIIVKHDVNRIKSVFTCDWGYDHDEIIQVEGKTIGEMRKKAFEYGNKIHKRFPNSKLEVIRKLSGLVLELNDG